MTGKLKRSFNVDRVAKRFYKQFRLEQRAFLGFVEGIAEVADREWYSLLMLNRLMFVYFIQKKGFLDGDLNYLENRLRQVQAAFAGDRFYSFYRYFLLRLFHDGLARPEHERTSELAALLGNVPYLNGGLFDVHELEQKYPKIQIADQAFERIVAFFEAYQWHLDDRPLRADNEINPDVLGYIFEKYVNQKQMGAYYTKEDITEYIAKNTIIPFLFDAARKECAVAFEKGSALWRLLQEDPDRYIDEPVRKGVDLELPIDIAAGLTDVSRRGGWNKPADPDFALPTETWREHVARRQRCQEIRSRLQSGEVCAIDDLITDNLNIRQFARDVIDNAEGPELVRAFYHAIEKVSVLDPTCGSGAFLFAALNVLEPLYDACLERMHGFLDEIERLSDEHRTERYLDFRRVLERVRTHPSREYFILKSIVVNNLYGVDIMEEAVEICKLRLFLKLVSQIENPADLEPLPDVDFNVRAGNTLVGFATRADVEKVLTTTATGQGKLVMFDDERETMHRLNEEAEIADRAFKKFRQMQTEHGLNAEEFRSAKRELRTRLDRLRDELDRYLARQYGIDDSDVAAFNNWHASHQPFHWFVEFYGIMKQGGFDVIVGNPPYVEYFDGKLPYRVLAYETRPCSNLYPMVIERSRQVLRLSGTHGMIVPLAAFATRNMVPFIDAFQHWFRKSWVSFYHFRPAMLFSGGKVASIPTAVYVSRSGDTTARFSTGVTKWTTDCRDLIFPSIHYTQVTAGHDPRNPHYYAKFSDPIENQILSKVLKHETISVLIDTSRKTDAIYYRSAGGLYWKVFVNFPWPYATTSNKKGAFRTGIDRDVLVAVLNSSLFWWYYTVTFDTFNLKDYMLFGFRFTYPEEPTLLGSLASLCRELMSDFARNAEHLKRGSTGSYTIYAKRAKPIIDRIDCALAKHYGFTDEELDFIINYDIKYRVGQENEGGEG